MMDITRAALRNTRVTVVAVVLLLIGGGISYFTLPQAEDPGFTVRIAQVITGYPGASPERVRDLVTRPLEDAIAEIGEVETLVSQSKAGVSLISVEIAFQHKDLDRIWDSLADQVDSVRDRLPAGVVGPKIEDDYGDVFSILLAITGEGYAPDELKSIAEDVRRDLQSLSEVGRVIIYGAPERRVTVSYDQARLQALGLTPKQLADAIQQTNVVRPGGSISIGREAVSIEPSGNYTSIEEIKRTLLTIPGSGTLLQLRDVSEINLGFKEPAESVVRVNGNDAVVLAVNMKEDGRTTVLGDQVRATVGRLRQQYPVGVDFSFVAFQPDIVAGLVGTFTSNVLQAILVVMLVMLIASGLRNGMVVASLIPATMIGTLLVMKFFGVTINQMSLASLVIVLGMLVDSAIVMTESTIIELRRGLSPSDAAVQASRELRVPLLTSALTTASAFLPIALAQTPAGEYTRPLFHVVTIALVLAWLLTITMIPFLSVRLLPQSRAVLSPAEGLNARRRNKGRQMYLRFLSVFLRHRFLTIAVFVLLLLGAGLAFQKIPRSFFPETSYPIFTMEISFPRGTSIYETERVTGEIEQFYRRHHAGDVSSFAAFVGGNVPRFRLNVRPQESRPEYVFFLVNARDFADVPALFASSRDFAARTAPDATVDIRPFTYGPPTDAPLEVRLSGENRDTLYQEVRAVKQQMAETDGVFNIRDDWGVRSKTLEITIDDAHARRYGITHGDVASAVQASTTGLEISEYRGLDVPIPILLTSSEIGHASVEDLERTSVYSGRSGTYVPLGEVASVVLAWQPSVIRQRDRLETITIRADTEGEANSIAAAAILESWLQERSRQWPVNFQYSFGGELQGSTEANSAILDQVPLALFIIAMLLVTQFNSIRRAAIILVTIPFGFIGVVAGLWVTGSTFSFMGLLGLVSLSGIVVNDAIVLVDRIEIERRSGVSPLLAVYKATLRKTRPIILTSVTTIVGLFPLLFFGGPLWIPMVSGLVFGLAFATVLTLGLVPTLYSVLFRLPRSDSVPRIEEIQER
jgi:multidrug efflux pump subunit AcrB